MPNLTELPIKDGLDAFAAEGNLIDGEWYKQSGKTGEWSVDGEVDDVREVRIVPFPETAMGGKVKWGKSEKGNPAIVEREVERIIDKAPAREIETG